MAKKIDLTGQKFGKLTILEEVGRTKQGKVIWRCLCECGNFVDVSSISLRSGNTQSCGCYKREQTSKRSRIDLIGQKFGRLTVLEDVGRQNRKVVWRCLCDCGNTVNVIGQSLQNGNTKSCSCIRNEKTSQRSYINLIGCVFGKLTVIEDVGRSNYGKVVWKCQCECGNTVDVVAGSLQNGRTQSCGCLHKELLSETMLGENNPSWRGGITPLNEAVRNCIHYKEWRTSIFQRDNFTCVHCNDSTGGNLIAHHIKFFSDIMKEHNITTLEEAIQCEALWDVSNGITLCKKCHKKEHKRKDLL
jgi:hypothetical protein